MHTVVNNDVPNWYSYRLSYEKMAAIYKTNRYWRLTCNHDRGLEYCKSDFVVRLKSDFDILSFVSRECVHVKKVDIRGFRCRNCQIKVTQNNNISLHINSFLSKCCNRSAEFEDRICSSGSGEHNFGYYGCINAKHSCSSSRVATKQIWIGNWVGKEYWNRLREL